MKKRIETDRHLNRQELLKAARSDGAGFDHLKTCRECRETVELLKAYAVAGVEKLENAPREWVNRAIAIAAESSPVAGLGRKLVEILFDSWAVPYPVGVRGIESLSHRRLRIGVHDMILDFRAEQMADQWAFVAEVCGKDISRSSIDLMAGKKPIKARKAGLYQWTSKRPPRKLSLRIDNAVFEIPELSWKKPRSK